jgi:hypothetical protein
MHILALYALELDDDVHACLELDYFLDHANLKNIHK